MIIAFIADQMRSGGAERVMANLSNEFISLGHIVYIIMLNESEERSHYYVGSGVKLVPVQKQSRAGNPANKVLLLKRCLKEIDPGVIITFQNHIHIYAYFASLGSKIPHIVSERSDPGQYPKDRLKRVLRSYVFNSANGCVFQTAGARDFFNKRIMKKSIIIPNPVVLLHEPEMPIVREKKIVAVGRLEKPKNYGMMIRAFALFSDKNPGYRLIICGEGASRSDIEELTSGLCLEESVVLMGHVSNPHEIVHNSAVFALSSDFEGMPNALLEAMALGVPSVSTDCPSGGPAELIRNNENGVLVPVGDVSAMADAFSRITSDLEFANKLIDESAKVRELYSARRTAEQWIAFIDSDIMHGKAVERKMKKKLKQAIQEDEYRNSGGRNATILSRFFNPNLKYLRAFRRAQYHKSNKLLLSYYKLKLSFLSRRYFIQIPWKTSIGKGFYIGHMGRIIINSRVIIGDNVNVATGITIGQTNRGSDKGCPKIGSRVWIGTNAVIVGNITIGDDVLIAPNSYVTVDVPSHSLVIGNPAQIKPRENATEGYINNIV